MATNTAGTAARQLPFQAVHFLRKNITWNGGQVTVGIIPAGSVIMPALTKFYPTTDFDGSPVLDFGTSLDPDFFGTGVDIAAVNTEVAVIDETVALMVAVDTTLVATVSGGSAAGAGELIVGFIPDIDG